MSLILDYDHEDKVLFNDNILVGRTEWGNYYFRVWVTDRGASLSRYCVPGRIDTYVFDWIPGSTGIGSRVSLFTDTGLSLDRALKQIKRDLKKTQVKELLKAAKIKCPRSYLDSLLEALR
jgi:hypothetical protein